MDLAFFSMYLSYPIPSPPHWEQADMQCNSLSLGSVGILSTRFVVSIPARSVRCIKSLGNDGKDPFACLLSMYER